MDAIATPFVQGRLRGEPLWFVIESECAHCGAPIRIEINSELQYRVDGDAQVLVYAPMVDFGKLEDPSIIDAF